MASNSVVAIVSYGEVKVNSVGSLYCVVVRTTISLSKVNPIDPYH